MNTKIDDKTLDIPAKDSRDFFMKKVTPYDKGGKPGKVIFRFGSKGIDDIELDIDTIPEEVTTRAKFHGLSQKIGDTASGFSKKNDFAGARNAMMEQINQLHEGQWNKVGRDALCDTVQGMHDMAQAIATMQKLKVQDVHATIVKATSEQRKTWWTNSRVKLAVDEIRLEREKGKHESEALDFQLMK